MSRARRCDRCKKFYDLHDEDDEVKRICYRGTRIYGISITDACESRLAYFDLCPECVKALDSFMNHNHPDVEESEE